MRFSFHMNARLNAPPNEWPENEILVISVTVSIFVLFDLIFFLLLLPESVVHSLLLQD